MTNFKNPLFPVCQSAIIYNVDQMESRLRNCTVIEGHLGLTNMFLNKESNTTSNVPSFPELREITEFLLLYLGEQVCFRVANFFSTQHTKTGEIYQIITLPNGRKYSKQP
jgi:hypothetical protein